MRYFQHFSRSLLSNWAAREPLLLCKCPFWTPWTGFIVWSSLSPGCNIPGCASDNRMDGSRITQDRAAGEQKKAAPLIRGGSSRRWRCVTDFIYLFLVQRFRQRPSSESRGGPRALLFYFTSLHIRIISWIDIKCIYFNVSRSFLHEVTDTFFPWWWTVS